MKIENAPKSFRDTMTFDAAAEIQAITDTLDHQVAQDETIDSDYWRGARQRLQALAGAIMSTTGGTGFGGAVNEVADVVYGPGRWSIEA